MYTSLLTPELKEEEREERNQVKKSKDEEREFKGEKRLYLNMFLMWGDVYLYLQSTNSTIWKKKAAPLNIVIFLSS